MEFDWYRPGYLVYTDKHALMTSDGTPTHLIAGNSTQEGYREGVGAEARFNYISGFTQISEKHVVLADNNNHCLRLIDRTTHNTSVFRGQHKSHGYQNGRPGRFYFPWSVVIDRREKYQLLITDHWNKAVRTVDVKSQIEGTFVRSESLWAIIGITQDGRSGDLFVTALDALNRVTYTKRSVSLISRSLGSNSNGYRDNTLLNSLFYRPQELVFITPQTLLLANAYNLKLRMLDMKSDKVTTLNVKNSLSSPRSLLLTNNSLYVGQRKKITQYKCEYNMTTINLYQPNFITDNMRRLFHHFFTTIWLDEDVYNSIEILL